MELLFHIWEYIFPQNFEILNFFLKFFLGSGFVMRISGSWIRIRIRMIIQPDPHHWRQCGWSVSTRRRTSTVGTLTATTFFLLCQLKGSGWSASTRRRTSTAGTLTATTGCSRGSTTFRLTCGVYAHPCRRSSQRRLKVIRVPDPTSNFLYQVWKF